jgi:hypothetical protein
MNLKHSWLGIIKPIFLNTYKHFKKLEILKGNLRGNFRTILVGFYGTLANI